MVHNAHNKKKCPPEKDEKSAYTCIWICNYRDEMGTSLFHPQHPYLISVTHLYTLHMSDTHIYELHVL